MLAWQGVYRVYRMAFFEKVTTIVNPIRYLKHLRNDFEMKQHLRKISPVVL